MVTHIASAVLAQTAPAPTQAESPSVVIYYAVIAVLLIVTVVISVMPSKRTHLD
jgi:hypothetical protein